MPLWHHPLLWFVLLLLAALLLAGVRAGLARILDSGDPVFGGAYLFAQGWIRLIHGFRVVADAPLPRPFPSGGCLVACNHASGLDPIALQLAIPRKLAWMMARDQMHAALAGHWHRFRLIPVSYGPKDTTALREAVRLIRGGGILGIFPEGGIVRPPGEVRPFLEGVGLVASLSEAPILLYWIEGAPYAATAFGAIGQRSRTTLHFLGEYRFAKGTPPAEIVRRLRERLVEASGWPQNDEPLVAGRNHAAVPIPSPE